MAKVLYVGDPHARPESLDEMWRLVEYIVKVAQEQKVQYICILGDLFHTHSTINLAVLGFWQHAFKAMAKVARVTVLVGNHDMSGREGDTNNSLMLYNVSDVSVVNKPTFAMWDAWLVPYIHDHDAFVAAAAEGAHHPVLVCHQTFDGSAYENGFYAKDGIDPNLVKQELVISGHIHTPQRVGKVWYPGAPRWQTVADANTERAIWVVDHADLSNPASYTAFPTAGVCTPIWVLEDREDAQADLIGRQGAITVDVHGSEVYVKARKAELEALGVRVRSFPTVQKVVKVKESDGLPIAYKKFLTEFKPKNGTAPERLMQMASERVSWLRGEG